MMKAKRYLILPMDGIRLSDATSAVTVIASRLLATLQPQQKAAVASLGKKLMASVAQASAVVKKHRAAVKKVGGANAPVAKPAIEVVASLHEDGVKLVVASEEVLAALRQNYPGIRVIEEKFCRPTLAPRAVVPPRPAVPAGAHVVAGASVVVEVVRGDTMTPIRGADVIAFRTDDDALQKKTNASGKATFPFGTAVAKLKRLYVYHEEPGIWGFFKSNVTVATGAVKVVLSPLDLTVTDSLRHFHKFGKLTDGEGVRVGVIDSGADRDHPDLVDVIEGGANCVPESIRPEDDFGPDGAHGTHVAGTIAARGTAPTGVRGVAPGAKLRIYRVFESGNPSSGSSFAVIDAIERAIEDKCDIINLSLGFDPGVTDDAISDALAKARNNGILAVAAAGNDRRQPVGFPGSDANCVAVSAVGRKGLFPATATEVDEVAAPFGLDPDNFIAAFSNVGADLDATGSGVGVVSTFPSDGYGPMSGTSMASPAVAGVTARLLAAEPEILGMARDAARSDAIRKLLMDACKSLGFGILFEGSGLPK
jgi:subtilisin